MNNSKKILNFLKNIKPLKVPNNISTMNPYHNKNNENDQTHAKTPATQSK